MVEIKGIILSVCVTSVNLLDLVKAVEVFIKGLLVTSKYYRGEVEGVVNPRLSSSYKSPESVLMYVI